MKNSVSCIFILTFILSGIFESFNASSQIPNADFELWDTIGFEQFPIDWIQESDISFHVISCTNEPYMGNFALKLNCWANYWVAASSKFPINFHPLVLHGFYEGNPDLIDTFSVRVELYSFNQIVDTGYWHYEGAPSYPYSLFTVIISQNSLACDS